MLVRSSAGASPPRRWLTARRMGLLLMAAALASIGPHLVGGTELVRVRNALTLGDDLPVSADWQPPAVPAGYKLETSTPNAVFTGVVHRLDLASKRDDWERALAIARHLLGSAGRLNGGPIHGSLDETYRGIVERGDGYCGDFERVFTAIANAAHLTVRSRSFAFDGFGGHGHIWVEVWSAERRKWLLLDVFQNYIYVDSDGVPLSALELRESLLAPSASARLRLIHEDVPPGWEFEPRAWDYLRRGLDQWYWHWGNNVHTYDTEPLVRGVAWMGRGVETLAAIAAGVHPQTRLLATMTNGEERRALHRLRTKLALSSAAGTLGFVLVVFGPMLRRRTAAAEPGVVAAGVSPPGWPRIGIVGPLPPPSGGMANQCEQLVRLLAEEGASVTLIRTNSPYRPAWAGRWPVLRAGFRLVPYLLALWRGIGRCDVVHVFANSGLAWHLFAYPALRVARWRRVPVIVNYRGGLADQFFSRAPRHVLKALSAASARVAPSAFLERVFEKHGLDVDVIPNIVDLSRFVPRQDVDFGDSPHMLVTRNLEDIYDLPTALRAFALVRLRHPGARLTVAGSGPSLAALEQLARELGIDNSVKFVGRIDNASIPALYARADLMLNPSTADNMPISILEALASGVPVVSTDVGGIPDLVQHERSALLVPARSPQLMADAALRLLGEPALRAALRQRGLEEASRYAWPAVRSKWRRAYWSAVHSHGESS